MSIGIALTILGGVLAVVAGGVGSAIGVKKIGKASAAIIAEEPEKFGKALVLTALPGTQGIYGFLVGIMVFQKVGLLTGDVQDLSSGTGLQLAIACLAAAIVCFFSAIYQGEVCVAGAQVLAKRPSEAGKSIILAAMVETYAVLGLLISILLINGIKIS